MRRIVDRSSLDLSFAMPTSFDAVFRMPESILFGINSYEWIKRVPRYIFRLKHFERSISVERRYTTIKMKVLTLCSSVGSAFEFVSFFLEPLFPFCSIHNSSTPDTPWAPGASRLAPLVRGVGSDSRGRSRRRLPSVTARKIKRVHYNSCNEHDRTIHTPCDACRGCVPADDIER